MKIYVFGNEDFTEDNKALKIASLLKKSVKDIDFIYIKPNEDLPFPDKENVIIMDIVEGIKKIKLFDLDSANKIILSPRVSTHDFDLGFQLRYLKKLGKLKKVKILGIPRKGKEDYLTVQSILRKLVAQDIQGS